MYIRLSNLQLILYNKKTDVNINEIFLLVQVFFSNGIGTK